MSFCFQPPLNFENLMKPVATTQIPDHFLFPATIFGHQLPHRVQTILGSCVSVCLFDEVLKLGAINHFMLPQWNGCGMPSPKYGDVAMHRLLEKMIGMGSRQESIVAKVFGGADQHLIGKGSFNVGSRNIDTALSILENEHIRIVAQNTGGNRGRKLLFFTNTNQVFIKFLPAVE
jgi:chemotaxis protein CheD